MKDRESFIRAVTMYPVDRGLEGVVPDFLALLAHRDSFQRYHLPGHITGSAWIVNRECSKTLLVRHARLQRWLQPGGHADGEEDVLSVALREATEETGLTEFIKINSEIFDLDIHAIPERKDFPAHLHYDVRFLMVADDTRPLTISDESTDLRWVGFDQVALLTENNKSVMRMMRKVEQGYHPNNIELAN